MQAKPTFRRRRLARRLRQMREQAGLTLEQAAARLDKTRSALGRVETGQSRADVHLVRSMMDLYDHYDPDLLDLAREASKPPWWAIYFRRPIEENRGFIGLEDCAATAFEFTLSFIPGLLQTEDYMRAVFDSGLVSRTERGLDDEVAARLHRQRRLTDPDFPIELVAVLDESALHRNLGGHEVMRAQLLTVLDLARLPNVSIQVLPNGVGAHPGLDGAFVVLEYADPGDPSILYVPYVTGALHIDNADEVARAKRLFAQLRERALSPEDSVVLVKHLVADAGALTDGLR